MEEAVEKLHVIKDLSPTAIKYNIEPNIEQPFNKLSPFKNLPLHQVLEDTKIIKNSLSDDINEYEIATSTASPATSNLISNCKVISPDDSPSFEASTTPPLSICLKNCQTAVIRKILLDSETPFVDLDLSPDNNDKPVTPLVIRDHNQLEEVNKMDDSLEIKIKDAFLSNAKENISVNSYKENVLRDTNLNFQDSEMEVRTN